MNLFKVEKVAICGSDIALYLWNEVAKVIATVPFIPGKYEYVILNICILNFKYYYQFITDFKYLLITNNNVEYLKIHNEI